MNLRYGMSSGAESYESVALVDVDVKKGAEKVDGAVEVMSLYRESLQRMRHFRK